MSDEILDEPEIRALSIPVTLKVDAETLMIEASKINTKFNIGIVIIMLISLVIGTFGIFFIFFGLFIFFLNKRKMDALKQYGGSQFTFTETGISCDKPEFPSKEISYDQVKSLTKSNWGLELSLKFRDDDSLNIIYVPKCIEQYESLLVFLATKNIKE